MKRALIALGLLLAAASGCEAPPVHLPADQLNAPVKGRIDGTVVVSSAARGNVLLFLFDAAHPPPPVGTGRPTSFVVLTEAAVFGSAAPGDKGPFFAPFTFSLVPEGDYLIHGFVDANDDFSPWFGVTDEPNRGDVGGAAVSADGTERVVSVVADDAGVPAATVDVRVGFTDALTLPVGRPAFKVAASSGTPGVTRAIFTLAPEALVQPWATEQNPAFLARALSDGGLWPHVVVRKMAEGSLLADENDLNHDGLLDDGGVDYPHVDPSTGAGIPPDGLPDLVVLKAGFDPSGLSQLWDGGQPKPAPTPVPSLTLVVDPVAIDASNPTMLQPLPTVPSGRYAIYLIAETGQTWRLPNELAPELAEGLGFSPVTSQGFFLDVP